jgi:hypothetical protein
MMLLLSLLDRQDAFFVDGVSERGEDSHISLNKVARLPFLK